MSELQLIVGYRYCGAASLFQKGRRGLTRACLLNVDACKPQRLMFVIFVSKFNATLILTDFTDLIFTVLSFFSRLSEYPLISIYLYELLLYSLSNSCG